MNRTKSFRYSTTEHPEVNAWVERQEKAGINFSEAVRRLIRDGHREREDINQEIEKLKKQITKLKERGHIPAPTPSPSPVEAKTDKEGKQGEEVEVNTEFIKNRYF